MSAATEVTILLNGEPIAAVLRAAAGTDPTARTRAVATLLGLDGEVAVGAVLNAMRLYDGFAAEVMRDGSGVIDVLASWVARDGVYGRVAGMLATAFEQEPGLRLSPLVFVGIAHFRLVNGLNRMLLKNPFDDGYPGHRRLANEDRARAMQAIEVLHRDGSVHFDFVDLVQRRLRVEKDPDLRQRMAAFLASVEARRVAADVPGEGKAKAKPRRRARG